MVSFARIFTILVAVFAASQVYWFLRGRALVTRLTKSRRASLLLTVAGLAIYLVLLLLNFGVLGGRRTSSTHMTWYDALISAPFTWWVVCSLVGFLLAILMWPARRVARSSGMLRSPGRRQFLERGANLVVAAPFVAGAYGLLYGRLNLEVTAAAAIRSPGCPAFHGFRIVQLSDIHIGPFMPEDADPQIRRHRQRTEAGPDRADWRLRHL